MKWVEEGNTVIIVHADSEFANHFAVNLSKQNVNLVLVGRNAEHMMTTVNQCVRFAKKPLMIVSDLDKVDEMDYFIKETIKKYKRCDMVLNMDPKVLSLPIPGTEDYAIKRPSLSYQRMSEEERVKYKKFLRL